MTLSVEDRLDIADVLVRYATGIDRRDWPLFQSCFTDDCSADYGDIGSWQGGADITEFMASVHARAGASQHRITNHAVTETPGGASARCYVDSVVLGPDGGGVQALGWYDDELVRTDGSWRIARREFGLLRMQILEGATA